MTTKKIILFFILVILIGTSAVSAQDSGKRDLSAEKLQVKIVVIGAADPVYSWWGHIAFLIENTDNGAARYYDYGNFSFEQESFLKNFIMGKMYYLKMASNPDRQLKYNAYLNRDITVYTLNVRPENRLKLLELLENDILPENRTYLYNLFFDNCSTRIRDRMDIITDNEFSRKYKVDSDKTLRIQLRRFLYSNILMDWLFNFALGPIADKTITEFDGMYLPKEMGRAVELMTVKDTKGNEVPFVTDKNIYNRAKGRPDIPDYPPPNWQYGLIAGILLTAAALLLNRSKKATAVLSLVLSFLLSIPGSLLFFMACFTEHNYSYWNINLLFINPFLIFTFIVSLRCLIKHERPLITLHRCWSITAAGAILSLLLKIIPFCRQDNLESILFILPISLILGIIPLCKDIVTRRNARTTADSL